MTASLRGAGAARLVIALVAGAASLAGGASTAGAAPPALKVVGTQIQTVDGKPVVLRGVNAASLEWTSDGEGHILNTVQTAIRDWHANIVRLPLSQDRWFGKAPEQTDGGKVYRALVHQIVDACSAANCYVLLDLHWSDENEWGKHIGQHLMPDQNSVAFWKDFAKGFRNNPAVLFDLYNEPHDVSWDVWQNGGPVSEKDRRAGTETKYDAVGMQQLLDIVRGAGARNVVVAGGIDWAYDMSGFLNGHQLSDPKGNGVIYANHFYQIKGDTIDQWIAKMDAATKVVPVIVSEFGSEARPVRPRPNPPAAAATAPGATAVAPGANPRPAPPPGGFRRPRNWIPDDLWVRRVVTTLMDRGWNFTAWDLHTAAGPRLVSDWNYTPTPSFGAYVKAALTGQPLPPPLTPTETEGAATAPAQ